MHTSTATRYFLTFFTLLQPHLISAEAQCAIDPNSIVSDACTSYANLDKLNKELAPSLTDLTKHTDFFAYYRLNLYNKVCPFWNDESSICGNRACAVDTIEDEEDIPPIWRAEELSKLEGLRAQHPGRQQQKDRPKKRPLQFQLGENVDESCVLEDDDECDERDYCVPEDEGAAAKGDYVSLVNNPEKFTGYSGPGAHQVWDSIYKENCFTRESRQDTTGMSRWERLQAATQIRNVFQEYGRHNVEEEESALDDECIEQRAFYRIISGMHTSISTHLCYDYFNQTTGEWFHNVECYRERLHDHPERVSNLYFNYALVTRAIAKLRKHLEHYTFCSGDPDQDFETKQKMLELADRAASAPHTFDENVMFQDPTMLDLKDDFKHRFRNVSRLMDCVGCDKCRLWGKVQTAGYGAALKVLFEFDETKNGENPHLRRTELVAMVNTLDRISHSLNAITWFREELALGTKGVIDESQPRVHRPEPARAEAKETDRPRPQSPHEAESAPIAKNQVREDTYYDSVNMLPDPDDFPTYRKRDLQGRQLTFSESAWDEIDLVWRAYMWVLRSWIELPMKMFAIGTMEMNRLWNWFIGLPVPHRSWNIVWPEAPARHDDL